MTHPRVEVLDLCPVGMPTSTLLQLVITAGVTALALLWSGEPSIDAPGASLGGEGTRLVRAAAAGFIRLPSYPHAYLLDSSDRAINADVVDAHLGRAAAAAIAALPAAQSAHR
jgi:hypothetical protein